MAKRTKEALLARLETSLGNLYHNATPHSPRHLPEALYDAYNAWFYSQAEWEVEYIQDGLGCTEKEYAKQARMGFTHNERHYWLVQRINEYGKLCQYGRGGRTLAPQELIRTHGGSSFSPRKADDFSEYSNERLTDMIAVIDAFNTYVKNWNSRENLTAMWQEECKFRRAEAASEAKALRKELKTLAREAKRQSLPASVCGAVLEKIRDVADTRRELVKQCAAYTEALTA